MKLTINSIPYPMHIFKSKKLILKGNCWLSRTWSTMANSQRKSDKIDSNTIIKKNENTV